VPFSPQSLRPARDRGYNSLCFRRQLFYDGAGTRRLS
jgi:hypothetical protein